MRLLKFGVLLFSVIMLTYCEKKKEDLVNLTTDAQIVGMVTEKCYCCWGWIINVGSTTIKADSLPGLSSLTNIVFPFNARITIGTKTRNCSEYESDMHKSPDYYEIEQFTIIE